MIIVRLQGGMGNQMFQYALGRNLSLKYNVPLVIDTTFLLHRIKFLKVLRPNFTFRDFDLDVFNFEVKFAQKHDISFFNRPIFSGKLMLIIDAIFRKLAIFPGWEKSFCFDEKILSIGPDAYLEGFWQSYKYFSNIEDIIREDFTLKNLPNKDIINLADEIKNVNSLCVHVRRGDYVGNVKHEVVDLEYYKKGFVYIDKISTIDKIYVFSDDIEWCKKNMKFPVPVVFVGKEYNGEKGEGHLFLMSVCRYFIIPNSTFSWWGAWLSSRKDKIVLVPKQWFRDMSIDTTDLIPEGWVKI